MTGRSTLKQKLKRTAEAHQAGSKRNTRKTGRQNRGEEKRSTKRRHPVVTNTHAVFAPRSHSALKKGEVRREVPAGASRQVRNPESKRRNAQVPLRPIVTQDSTPDWVGGVVYCSSLFEKQAKDLEPIAKSIWYGGAHIAEEKL